LARIGAFMTVALDQVARMQKRWFQHPSSLLDGGLLMAAPDFIAS